MTKAKKTVTLERNFDASIDDVWELWTTKEGLESWWGPEGFVMKVLKLQLRVGGTLEYAMTAIGKDQVAFMKKAGMPTTTEARVTFTEITPKRALAFDQLNDFIPDVKPYTVGARVEFKESAKGVKMTVILDAMHDATWTERAVMGWESQLGKLAKVLAA